MMRLIKLAALCSLAIVGTKIINGINVEQRNKQAPAPDTRGNMLFPSPLIKGKLIKRYKRFMADVELEDGNIVTAHCPNTGAMTGCAEPGFEVWLSPSDNPKRKLAYTWELSRNHQQHWIGINTNNANKLVDEALDQGTIEPLNHYTQYKREVKFGEENSRIDFVLSSEQESNCFVEVKSVTLLRGQTGLFPDAKTVRGTKHLRELTTLAQTGCKAVLFYCVQHTGIEEVKVAADIDPEYARTLHTAIDAGVQILVYTCEITEQKIHLNQPLNFCP